MRWCYIRTARVSPVASSGDAVSLGRHPQLHPPVLRAPFGRIVARDRLIGSESHRRDARRRNAFGDKVGAHDIGACLVLPDVRLAIAGVVGVSLDPKALSTGSVCRDGAVEWSLRA